MKQEYTFDEINEKRIIKFNNINNIENILINQLLKILNKSEIKEFLNFIMIKYKYQKIDYAYFNLYLKRHTSEYQKNIDEFIEKRNIKKEKEKILKELLIIEEKKPRNKFKI